MGPRTRKALAMAGSTIFHGGLLFWGAFVYAPEFDFELDVEFEEVELLDPDMIQGQQPQPAEVKPVEVPPPTPQPTPEPAKEPEKKEETKKDEEKKEDANQRDLGKRKTQVDQLGPTNSTFYMLLVPKKIRQLSYGARASEIMAPLPDYQYLVAGGGLDALEDFDHLVIASSDIRDWTQTFLAVDYKMPRAEMKAAIERAVANADETIEWTDDKGILRGNPKPEDGSEDVDPRWFVLLEDNIAVYVREEFLPHVLGEQETGEEATAGAYVANLAKLRKFASRQPTAGMQLVMKDLRAATKRVKGLPFQLPDRIELSVEATEEPELLVRFDWPELVETKAFEIWWNDELPKILDGNLKAKPFKWMVYDIVEARRKQNAMELWARFETDQAAMLLGIIADQTSKLLKKTPQELAAQRRERLENFRKRQEARERRPQGPAQGPSLRPGDANEPPARPKPSPAPAEDPPPDVPNPDPDASPSQG
jgi:outer membrane biosynthesis protein TonB